jgi:hypothetical protein
VVGNDAVRTCRLRSATLPVAPAATRFAEFSRVVPFGKTVRNRADARFASDSVEAADEGSKAAPVDFPDFAGIADERLDSAEAADGLVFDCRLAPPVAANDAVRTCRLRPATLPVGLAATRLVPR